MSQPSRAQGAYSWTGTLKNTNIRQLYERCQRLRLTGRMQLHQGDQSLELVWIGGEPIETETDQGTRSLPLWNSGDFTVEQCIPDWKGQLTKSVELTGSMRAALIQSIYKLCADNQLSADVELLRQNGEAAQVRFTLGKAEAATISGQTESALTALSKLSAWSDGTYRVVLRPLFGDVQAAEAPVFSEKDQSDDQFDVTGSMDIARGGINSWPPKLREPAAIGQPVPMGGSPARSLPGATAAGGGAVGPSASSQPPVAAASSASAPSGTSSPGPKNSRLASTMVSGLAAPSGEGIPSSALPTQPMSTMSRENAMKLALAESQASAGSPKAPPAVNSAGRTLVVVSISVIILCALAVGGLLVWKQLQARGATSTPPPIATPVT
jgi:hypothetical protein